MRQFALPIVAIVGILLVGTILQGKYTDRWGQDRSEKLKVFSSHLQTVPLEFGPWRGEENPYPEEQQEQFKASHCDAFLSRTFENKDTGERVNMYLVSGAARHVTIHTPDWCYRGAGYEMEGDPVPRVIECDDIDPDPQFLTATFLKEEPTMISRLRIFWSFTDNGQWLGPRFEKAAFAGRSALFKVYLISEISRNDNNIQNDPAVRFAKDLIPLLNRKLFSDPPSAGEPSEEQAVAAAARQP